MKPENQTNQPANEKLSCFETFEVQCLLHIKEFNAGTTAEQFFAFDTAELDFCNSMIDSLIAEGANSFTKRFPESIIKTYHLAAYDHLYKSKKSRDWHEKHVHHLPEATIIAHCTARTRKSLTDCAQKCYDMLTSARVRDCKKSDRIRIRATAEREQSFHNLAQTLDELVRKEIIQGKPLPSGVIRASDCVNCLLCSNGNCHASD